MGQTCRLRRQERLDAHARGHGAPDASAFYSVYTAFPIAWAIRIAILRWGSVKTYRNCVPFSTGLMVGHYAGRAVSLTTSMVYQRPWTL